MFVYELVEEPVNVPGLTKTFREYVIDRERGYALYPITGAGRDSTRAMILVAGTAIIPFETTFENPLDEFGLRTVTQYISPFGYSHKAKRFEENVKPFEFSSEQQKSDLLQTAAEGVLVFTCRGIEEFIRDEGRVKVQAAGRVFTRRSFNLPTSS